VATTAQIRYFEDFAPGLRFASPAAIVVTAERIKSFAAEFDPQPVHVDEARARTNPLFGGVVASGWHTAAVAMRLVVDSDLGLCGQGAGVEIQSMRWIRAVQPNDALRLEGTVTESRPSRSRATLGLVKFRTLVYNQRDELVLDAVHVVLMPRRSATASSGEA
jgi:acyl dehydratase